MGEAVRVNLAPGAALRCAWEALEGAIARASDRAWSSSPAAAASVLAALWSRWSGVGEVWPGQASLARLVKLSLRTVQRALCDLVGLGLVSRRAPEGRARFTRATTRYSLALPSWVSSSKASSSKASSSKASSSKASSSKADLMRRAAAAAELERAEGAAAQAAAAAKQRAHVELIAREPWRVELSRVSLVLSRILSEPEPVEVVEVVERVEVVEAEAAARLEAQRAKLRAQLASLGVEVGTSARRRGGVPAVVVDAAGVGAVGRGDGAAERSKPVLDGASAERGAGDTAPGQPVEARAEGVTAHTNAKSASTAEGAHALFFVPFFVGAKCSNVELGLAASCATPTTVHASADRGNRTKVVGTVLGWVTGMRAFRDRGSVCVKRSEVRHGIGPVVVGGVGRVSDHVSGEAVTVEASKGAEDRASNVEKVVASSVFSCAVHATQRRPKVPTGTEPPNALGRVLRLGPDSDPEPERKASSVGRWWWMLHVDGCDFGPVPDGCGWSERWCSDTVAR